MADPDASLTVPESVAPATCALARLPQKIANSNNRIMLPAETVLRPLRKNPARMSHPLWSSNVRKAPRLGNGSNKQAKNIACGYSICAQEKSSRGEVFCENVAIQLLLLPKRSSL